MATYIYRILPTVLLKIKTSSMYGTTRLVEEYTESRVTALLPSVKTSNTESTIKYVLEVEVTSITRRPTLSNLLVNNTETRVKLVVTSPDMLTQETQG